MTLRAGLLLLCCPLLGCATARAVRLDTGEGAPIVYTPARRVAPVEIDQRAFEKAMTTLLLEMKFSLSDGGHPHLRLASAEEVPGGRYHRWCSQQSAPDECLSLLEGGLSLADSSARRQLALSFAWDGVWDGVASEIRSIVNPVMLKLMISTAFAAYIGLLILPEPVTKAVAVALTTFLVAYVGLEVFFNILDGWRALSARSERAQSFRELEDAGHRFGDVMGRDGARVIILAVTAALGGGTASFASKAPALPGFARAALAARTNAGFELSVALEGGARSVTVAEGVMTVGVAPNVVAAVATGSPGGVIRPSGLGSGAAKDVDLTMPQRRKHILDGDGPGKGGGHRPGTGKNGKSEFPKGWDDDRIIHEISDVATDPASRRTPGFGGRTIVEGTRDGVDIRVIVDSNGNIITGFPTNQPRNP